MGPLEFLVLTFPGEVPGADAIGALARVRRSGDIRVVDSLVVTKALSGNVTTVELADMGTFREVAPGIAPMSLIGAEDAWDVAATLAPGTCAIAVLVEHAWARDAAEALRGAGGRIAASVRVPAEYADDPRPKRQTRLLGT
jgi:uncharacterized membrane protein